MTKHIYMAVSNYPEEITGHFKGEQIGYKDFERWVRHRLACSEKRPIKLEDFSKLNIVKENLDEMYKPLFKRKEGRWLLDALKPKDTLAFFTPAYAGCDAKDLGLIFNHCYRNRIEVVFAGDWPITFFNWDTLADVVSHEKLMKLLQEIGNAAYKFRCIRSKVTHYHSKKHRLCCGQAPIGFKKNRFNKLIPDWDSHVLLRLIVYLRDIHSMKWTEISRRLAELYSKPGRHYPTASKAKIPWSPQMCVKGHRAWKKIRGN